jgi:hypothetical protein
MYTVTAQFIGGSSAEWQRNLRTNASEFQNVKKMPECPELE